MENGKTGRSIEQKQLTQMRLQTVLLVCILALLIGATVFLSSQVTTLQDCINLIEKDVQALDMDALNDAVQAMTDAAKSLSTIDINALNNAVTSLRQAADTLGGVDIKALNGAVTSLKGAAETLKGVDVQALNSLVESLETVANKLENAVNAVTGIFHR